MANANPPTVDQLISVLQQQQQLVQQLLANQLQQNAAPAAGPPTIAIPSLPDIHPFEPTDDKSRISEWLARFKFALDCAAPNAIDATKVKCFMNKLSEAAFSEYSRSVLPSAVTDFNYDETILKMEKLFARPQSVFIDRYECLKAARHDGEDFRQFINRHRKLLKDFDFDSITKEQFQCLMLLTSLRSSEDASLRQRILIKLAADKYGITYDSMVEDLINFQTTIAEAKLIERPSAFKNVSALKRGKEREQQQMPSNSRFANNSQNASTAQRKCWRCAGDHRASHRFPNGTIKAIAHASKSLAPAEKNYSQIEKEGLALIFAVQKFHKMIYGRKFILQKAIINICLCIFLL